MAACSSPRPAEPYVTDVQVQEATPTGKALVAHGYQPVSNLFNKSHEIVGTIWLRCIKGEDARTCHGHRDAAISDQNPGVWVMGNAGMVTRLEGAHGDGEQRGMFVEVPAPDTDTNVRWRSFAELTPDRQKGLLGVVPEARGKLRAAGTDHAAVELELLGTTDVVLESFMNIVSG
jgi:hypothetical protein